LPKAGVTTAYNLKVTEVEKYFARGTARKVKWEHKNNRRKTTIKE
jgi:hypothetical protein